MSIRLEQTVPFGRSLHEYASMFSLDAADHRRHILDCAAGPSSFNAELTAAGGRVCSIDPLYQFTGAEIQRQFCSTLDHVIEQVRATPQNWVWGHHRDPEDLRRNRITVMETFVADYSRKGNPRRYVCGLLPALPFKTDCFDLALSSHFLFLYSDHFDAAFHLNAIRAMLRVAPEVRIFPLLALRAERSQHVEPVCEQLRRDGHHLSIERVSYELQRGGNDMLRLRRGRPDTII